MFIFFYNFFWTLILIFSIPFVALLGKGRISERLALGFPEGFPGEGNIWIHALSVGEVVSAISLVKALRTKFPGKDIVFSVTTSKGMAIARDEVESKVKALVTMPVDAWWCVRRIVNYLKPSIFVLVETDIWPGLIYHLSKRGIRAILVNGRVSPRTFRSYRVLPFLTRGMFQPLELCLMQSELDSKRLLKIGIGPGKVKTIGNIKFDRNWKPMGETERKDWMSLLGIEPGTPIWVAGSTHPGEERALLEVFRRLRTSFPGLRLILAPRDIERSGEIRSISREMGLEAVSRATLLRNKTSYEVLILDTLGELERIYGLSIVSFVGGSLVPVGGHNLLEPASFGCPVLFGPYTHNFVSMSESLTEAGGGWRVEDGEELFDRMKMLLSDPEKRDNMGRLAREFVERNRGALDRVLSFIADRACGC
jgi:3-deoxy-D-manno-octulosonic-acid transferase